MGVLALVGECLGRAFQPAARVCVCVCVSVFCVCLRGRERNREREKEREKEYMYVCDFACYLFYLFIYLGGW